MIRMQYARWVSLAVISRAGVLWFAVAEKKSRLATPSRLTRLSFLIVVFKLIFNFKKKRVYLKNKELYKNNLQKG